MTELGLKPHQVPKPLWIPELSSICVLMTDTGCLVGFQKSANGWGWFWVGGWNNGVCLVLPKSTRVISNLTFSAGEKLSLTESVYNKTEKPPPNSSVISHPHPFNASASYFWLLLCSKHHHMTSSFQAIGPTSISSFQENIILENLSQIVQKEWTKETPVTYLCFCLFQV